ncbi:hypothetical protein KP509_09G057600 [Ceratopteris richardii]|uniref:Lysosomal Pro-X carboxypeptidase n=1 Tax=Ceratopteris richardii TaxID=49495 RepID=A0A8T2U1I5_CERRI|nr:hypothetical protein KP509_09G057600 [Ceratopteris richardii]
MGCASFLPSYSPSPIIFCFISVITLSSLHVHYCATPIFNAKLNHLLNTRPHLIPSHTSSSLLYQSRAGRSLNGSQGDGNYAYKTLFYTQTLDHFSFTPSSYRTFQQRYLVNEDHWGGANSSAPIFVYCGNEGDIEWFASNTGFLWEIAPMYSAMVVFIEHRYYGESIPDIAQSNHSTETLGYLTSEQALADYAALIRDFKRNLSAEDCPVVAFGGSYGGMLAAWFRLKYPHIVVGALASSAPILHFDNEAPLDGFYRIVSENFKNVSSECFETISSSWDALSAAYTESGAEEKISRLFGFCRNVSADLSSVQGFLYTAWVYMAMTNYPYPSNFLEPMPGNPVAKACEAMDALPPNASILERIVAGVNIYYNGTGETNCFEFGSDTHGLSLWTWQACTEMVMPMSSDPENSMFPPYNYSFESTEESCLSAYGVRPRPHWITLQYGGPNLLTTLKRFGSNIVFSNGLLDPWSIGGVLTSLSDSIVALVTSKGAHHLDLRAATDSDPGWLVEQRDEEKRHISRWLSTYYADYRSSRRHGAPLSAAFDSCSP